MSNGRSSLLLRKGRERRRLAEQRAGRLPGAGQDIIGSGVLGVPEGTTAEKIDTWNDAFFGSFFTHPNVRKNLVKYRGGSYKFWKHMLDGKFAHFPERVLVPVQTTLGQLLDGNAKRND